MDGKKGAKKIKNSWNIEKKNGSHTHHQIDS